MPDGIVRVRKVRSANERVRRELRPTRVRVCRERRPADVHVLGELRSADLLTFASVASSGRQASKSAAILRPVLLRARLKLHPADFRIGKVRPANDSVRRRIGRKLGTSDVRVHR